MVSPVTVVKSEGPKLVPFFKATCVYFVLWLPTSSPSWFSALIKCLPIFCLWVFLLAHGISFLGAHSSARKILAGLIFSALGDAFLIWQEQGYFSHGFSYTLLYPYLSGPFTYLVAVTLLQLASWAGGPSLGSPARNDLWTWTKLGHLPASEPSSFKWCSGT
ncbi:hypothetical protein cypCar_00003358 [Cyprinus carpio]|nr:hypothetical protein cypCar_00003358 [Cyprinus carpio]